MAGSVFHVPVRSAGSWQVRENGTLTGGNFVICLREAATKPVFNTRSASFEPDMPAFEGKSCKAEARFLPR